VSDLDRIIFFEKKLILNLFFTYDGGFLSLQEEFMSSITNHLVQQSHITDPKPRIPIQGRAANQTAVIIGIVAVGFFASLFVGVKPVLIFCAILYAGALLHQNRHILSSCTGTWRWNVFPY
jgi:hypothetical protein